MPESVDLDGFGLAAKDLQGGLEIGFVNGA